MQTSTPTAVDLAEKYEYAALVRAVQVRPELAQEVDDFGMTPLHWVCSDPRVPARVLQKLVLAHPRATATTNLAGLLPLHIALRKNLPLDALKLLLKFYPKAVAVATPDGRTPLELANEHVTAPSARLFLQMLDAEVRALGRVAAASKKQQKQQQLRDACEAPPSTPKPRASSRAHVHMVLPPFKESAARDEDNQQHQLLKEDELAGETLPASPAAYRDPINECLSSPSMRAAAVPQRAPTWKLAKRCHICDCKFGYFKNRHHCRNCGESVCGRHSRGSLPLRHLGLFHPQRVCAVCHEHLQNTLAGCNTNESGLEYSRSRADSGVSSRFSFSSEDQQAVDCSSSRSLFWSPEALSPRVFGTNVPPPPKRTRSVREFLLATPRRRVNNALASPSSVASPTAQSPAARSVRSDSVQQRNYSHATLSSMPMFPSTASMFLSRVQMAPAPSHLVQTHRKELEQQARHLSRREEGKQENDDDECINAHGPDGSRRRLAKTDLDAPSKAWYEELDQLPPTPGEKLSMDSRVSELEQHVQKLLAAKKQIGAALKKSQRQIHLARAEKDKYDAIAQKYLDDGYAPCAPPSPQPQLLRGDLELAEALGCAGPTEVRARQEPTGSSCTASTSASSRETQSEGRRESDFDNSRSPLSDESASQCARPSSPLPAPRLSPFRSEKLALHIPLDVAATHHELGVVLLGKCDFSSAAAEFRKSLAINADNAVAWYHLAKALDGAGELEAAEHAVNKSLALDATSLPSLSLLGRLLHVRGEHDEAIIVFRKALNLQCPPNALVEVDVEDSCGAENSQL